MSKETSTQNPTPCCKCCCCCAQKIALPPDQKCCCTRGCNPMEVDNAAQTTIMQATGKPRQTALEQLKQNKVSQNKFEFSYIS